MTSLLFPNIGLHRAVFHSLIQLPLTFAIFCLGVGLKFCMKYGVENTTYSASAGNYSAYRQRYAWMITISAASALFCVSLSRYAHEWSNYRLWGTCMTRKWLRTVHFVIAGMYVH